jgi:hypothetical protein
MMNFGHWWGMANMGIWVAWCCFLEGALWFVGVCELAIGLNKKL